MTRKVLKSCPFCQHEDRDHLENMILSGELQARELDRIEDWRSGTSRKHMQNHLGDYHDNSNESCPLCVAPNRGELESAIVDGQIKPSRVAEMLGVGVDLVNLHMKKHLKPLVQKAASMEIARKEINEIEVLSGNLQLLQTKLQEFIFDAEDLDHKTIDSLVKLSKEIRESLKYALEFKGQLVHKREETVVVQQVEVIQRVLIEKYPEVWSEIRDSVAERLA
jgi:hypothetical protein